MIMNDGLTIEKLKHLYRVHGAPWMAVNLGGIRNEEKPDTWNDVLWCATDSMLILSRGTTDPGKNAVREHREGADSLQYGFQGDLWVIGWHGGQDKAWRHRAFVQAGTVDVTRDTNRNGRIDPEDKVIAGASGWGINRHSVIGPVPETIRNWSWGCQVVMHLAEHEETVRIAEKSGQTRFGNLLVPLSEQTQKFYTWGMRCAPGKLYHPES